MQKYTPFRRDEIMPRLFVGSFLGASTMLEEELSEAKVTHVLTLMNEVDRLKDKIFTPFKHKHVSLLDEEETNFLPHFEECISFIEKAMETGAVYVLSFSGVSRVTVVAMAFLMKIMKLSFEEGEKMFSSRRFYSLGNSQRQQLEVWGKMEYKFDAKHESYVSFLKQRKAWIREKAEAFKAANEYEIPDTALERRRQILLERKESQSLSIDAFAGDPTSLRGNEPEIPGSPKSQQPLYLCGGCRRKLFKGSNVIPITHDSYDLESWNPSRHIFIEPLDWMPEDVCTADSGRLCCPVCELEIGDWDWKGCLSYYSSASDFGDKLVPSFRVRKVALTKDSSSTGEPTQYGWRGWGPIDDSIVFEDRGSDEDSKQKLGRSKRSKSKKKEKQADSTAPSKSSGSKKKIKESSDGTGSSAGASGGSSSSASKIRSDPTLDSYVQRLNEEPQNRAQRATTGNRRSILSPNPTNLSDPYLNRLLDDPKGRQELTGSHESKSSHPNPTSARTLNDSADNIGSGGSSGGENNSSSLRDSDGKGGSKISPSSSSTNAPPNRKKNFASNFRSLFKRKSGIIAECAEEGATGGDKIISTAATAITTKQREKGKDKLTSAAEKGGTPGEGSKSPRPHHRGSDSDQPSERPVNGSGGGTGGGDKSPSTGGEVGEDEVLKELVVVDADGRTPPKKSGSSLPNIEVTGLEDLPKDIRKLVKASKIPEEDATKNFVVLLNCLHFLTKRSFLIKRDGEEIQIGRRKKKKEPKDKEVPREEACLDGANIKKDYRVQEVVGQGGFGRVFAAKSTKGKGRAAIKKMPHTDERSKLRNFKEIHFLASTNHPNIVSYHCSYLMKDELWVVMEFMEGGTLTEAIKGYEFLEKHIAYAAKEMLKGIKYLHSRGLVHRDLKSANIMMTTQGDVKLIDFGLCVDMSDGKKRDHMVGSPFWMPPEMIRREEYGAGVDIWSFAICLCELANGEPPNRKSALKAMFTAGTVGYPQPFNKPNQWSEEFKDFMARCLTLDPDKRATAEQLLNHPFLKRADTRKGMKRILSHVFLQATIDMMNLGGL